MLLVVPAHHNLSPADADRTYTCTQINSVGVSGLKHSDVVKLIKAGGNTVIFKILEDGGQYVQVKPTAYQSTTLFGRSIMPPSIIDTRGEPMQYLTGCFFRPGSWSG